MVDKSKPSKKETTKVIVVKNSKKESKSEAFLRLAEHRVKSVLRTLRILGNCSNRANYEYTSEQVETMYSSILEALKTIYAKFTPSKQEQENFKF